MRVRGWFQLRGVANHLVLIENIPSPYTHLSAVLNCEYQLYELNATTPLRHNPFLSHWVEVVQRWDDELARLRPTKGKNTVNGPDLGWREIHHTRVGLVKYILTEPFPESLPRSSPRALYHHFETSSAPAIDLDHYITILEEEDIYDRSPRPSASTTPTPIPITSLSSPPSASPYSSPPSDNTSSIPPTRTPSSPSAIRQTLRTNRAVALQALVRLPIDLPSLEFINSLLLDHTLEDQGIEPGGVVREYLEHALRRIERTSPPNNTYTHHPSNLNSNRTTEQEDTDSGIGGREEQIRAIKLLVLFIGNLIRKGLVQPEKIYFEIQEICVRFVWIREVREFRSFVEEGGF
ncbi:hypothetical protein M501DRAFT_1005259 [Patellaria atrata CBS 101060]|uniref:CCR4-NOT transcription complex subunit 11 n=1 Tax=Patellaria atrata CBS 101060 TaxID=1346257 RepID=A0A9P4S9D2_9PEZI|nr:hypothetical protein M501DRAFT_1005259 [Patellaria atrata CBS 101060]